MQLSESDWSLCCQRPNGKIAKSDLDGRDVALSVSHSVEGMSEYFIFLILSSAFGLEPSNKDEEAVHVHY